MGDNEQGRGEEEALAQKERWDSLLQRVLQDEGYRQQLVREPMETLRESGIELEDIDEVVVYEFDPRRLVLVLPPLGVELAEEPSREKVPRG
jgi:hypothetical protein